MDTELSKLSLLERSIVTPFLNEDQKETIAIYPGAFKPPHRGHLSVVEKANELADKTIVIYLMLQEKMLKQKNHLEFGKYTLGICQM